MSEKHDRTHLNCLTIRQFAQDNVNPKRNPRPHPDHISVVLDQQTYPPSNPPDAQ